MKVFRLFGSTSYIVKSDRAFRVKAIICSSPTVGDVVTLQDSQNSSPIINRDVFNDSNLPVYDSRLVLSAPSVVSSIDWQVKSLRVTGTIDSTITILYDSEN